MVLGAGFNLYAPAEGFPEDIAASAGAILDTPREGGKNQLAAAFLNRFWSVYREPGDYVDAYRARSLVLGKPIWVSAPEGQREAQALGLDDQCGLIVEYPDGTRQTLKAGEVRIREKKG